MIDKKFFAILFLDTFKLESSESSGCEDGYKPIIDVDNCESAASGLGLTFDKSNLNDQNFDPLKAICKWAPKTTTKLVRMINHPHRTMLCEKGIQNQNSFKSLIITILILKSKK